MTLTHDIHAHCVQAALESRGHEVKRWIGDHFPSTQTSSLYLRNECEPQGNIQTSHTTINLSETLDVVWLRRPRWPVVSTKLDPHDVGPADFELKEWYRSICGSSWKTARWINSIAARRAANNKILQLKLASRIGLTIPETLRSNSPDEVKRFVSEAATIVKPFYTQSWQEDRNLYHSFTATLNYEDLPEDPFIAACPTIYQRRITKSFEVRAFFCGTSVQCIALESQRHPEAENDWRTIDPAQLSPRTIAMPEKVKAASIDLMQQLGIVTGSFDFAVTRDGEWIFFEVNEQGQFLWMEEVMPEVPALDMFVQFIEAKNPSNFQYERSGNAMKYETVVRGARVRELSKIDARGAAGPLPSASL